MALFLKTGAIFAPLLIAGSALASDLPIRSAATPMAVQSSQWQGLFVGLNGGAGRAQNCWSYLYNITGPAAGVAGKEGCESATTPVLGGQIGYNLQLSNFVATLEISGDFAATKTSMKSALFTSDVVNTRAHSFFTTAGRLGYAYDKYLVYLKSGIAWQQSDYERIVPNPAIAGWIERAKQVRTGLVLGTGVERMLTADLSVAAEYDYVAFGSISKAVPTVATGPSFSGTQITPLNKIRQDMHFAGLRLNYYFK